MSKSLRDLYLRSSEILHNWQEVVLVFRYDSSFLLCESCKTSQRAMAVTNICQSERVLWPTSNNFFSCPTNQQLRHGFTPGHLSTDAAPGQDSASLIWQRLTQRRRQRSLNLAGRRRRRGRTWWSADRRWRWPLPTTAGNDCYAAEGNTQGVQGCCEDAYKVLLGGCSSDIASSPWRARIFTKWDHCSTCYRNNPREAKIKKEISNVLSASLAWMLIPMYLQYSCTLSLLLMAPSLGRVWQLKRGWIRQRCS